MKEIYVEVLTEPVIQPMTTKYGVEIGKIAYYYAKWDGLEILVQGAGTFIETLPSRGSRGLIRGQFEDQRFYDDDGKKLDMPYFFVE